MQPREGAEDTYIFESSIRQLVIPPVLHLGDSVPIGMNLHNGINGLLFPKALDDVSGPQVHGHGVARTRHLVGQSFDLGESGRESIPAIESQEGVFLVNLPTNHHCAEYCLRPSAMVRGSSNFAPSVHKDSFLTEGRPANS